MIPLNLKAGFSEVWRKCWSPFNYWELIPPTKQILSSVLRQILIVQIKHQMK